MSPIVRMGRAKEHQYQPRERVEATSIEELIILAESKFASRYIRRTATEAAGPCPWCGGEDRFIISINSGYWCRQCNKGGWLFNDDPLEISKQELAERREAARQRAQAEYEAKLAALEKISHSQAHIHYHENLNLPRIGEVGLDYWAQEGMAMRTILEHQLGYCTSCPTYPPSGSFTIPVTHNGHLLNIRHRLQNPPKKADKYRPHMAGLPSTLFNLDKLNEESPSILIAEGEKKSIIYTQEAGQPSVAVMGMMGFHDEWVSLFDKYDTVYVCLDPDAIERAAIIAELFKGRGLVVDIPVKLDDMFTLHGGSTKDMNYYLETARKP